MKNPGSPEQLADAIEALVASYMDEVRLAAQRAVERTLTRGSVARPPSRGRSARPAAPKAATKRRTAAELDEVCEQLCKAVRARPGASKTTLADEMGVAVGTLLAPMAKLRAEGRVRSVGERHLTRYFPAVVRSSAGKE
jgi:hypothetical protein